MHRFFIFRFSKFSGRGLRERARYSVASIMAQLSPDNNDDRSSVLGVEFQVNFPVSESFVLGIHANLQEQEYGDIAPVRVGGGVSLNYYKRLNTMTTYMGIKRTYYDEWIAKTQDA